MLIAPLKEKPLVMAGCAVYPYSDQLNDYLSFETKMGECVRLGVADGDVILVPRNLAPDNLSGVKDTRTKGRPIKKYAINCTPKDEDQARVISDSITLLKRGQSFITEASTGYGKTVIGVFMAQAMGLKTLIVVNKTDNLKNWHDAFLKFTSLKEEQIGIIQQSKCEVEGRSVCIGMVHSLAKDYYGDIYKEFGLIIFDEVHHMAAETFAPVCSMFLATLRVGLSATPTRGDGKEFVFESHIGPPLVFGKKLPVSPKILIVKSDFKLPLVNRKVKGEWKRAKLPHEPGKCMHVFKMLAADNKRNQIIVDFVKSSYNKGRHTLVLSDLGVKLHLAKLRSMLVAAGVKDGDIGYYVGGMAQSSLSKNIQRRVVLATYGFAGEATNHPIWSAVAMATPRANAKQAIGRACREHPNKPPPVILDIVDEDSWVFEEYFNKRRLMYMSPEVNGKLVYM